MTDYAAQCEAPRCDRAATWSVRGHWTVFDWRDYYVCGQHLNQAHKALDETTIDGLDCQERTSRYIGTEG